MAGLSLTEAEEVLRRHGSYGWLLDGQAVWSVAEVKAELDRHMHVQPSERTVGEWFSSLTNTQNFGPKVGMRATRGDLILFFAGRTGAGQPREE